MITETFTSFLHQPGELVVLVSDEYPPETGFGGIGSYTWNMTKGLAEQGCRVIVISKGIKQSSVVVNDRVAVVRFGYSTFWHRAFFKLCRWAGLERTVRSLLFSWNVYWQIQQIKKQTEVLAIEGPEWNAQLFWVAKLTRWPYAIRIHTPLAKIASLDTLPKSLDISLGLKMEAASVAKATTIFYASDISLHDAKQIWPLQTQRLVRCPLPIDRSVFAGGHHRSSKPTVIFVGRLEAKKGVDILVEALPLVRQKVANVQCLIIGPDGKDEQNNSMLQRLESAVTASGLSKSVEFIGPTSYQQLPQFLQQAWVLANPSKYESFGMTSLEAVSCGARTVVSQSVGFAEWLEPSLGSVLPERTAECLAAALVRCLTTKSTVDQEYVDRVFGLSAVALLTLTTYRLTAPSQV